jgi:hypothetical protein
VVVEGLVVGHWNNVEERSAHTRIDRELGLDARCVRRRVMDDEVFENVGDPIQAGVVRHSRRDRGSPGDAHDPSQQATARCDGAMGRSATSRRDLIDPTSWPESRQTRNGTNRSVRGESIA